MVNEPDLANLASRARYLEWYNQWFIAQGRQQKQFDFISENVCRLPWQFDLQSFLLWNRRFQQIFYINTFQRDPRCLDRAGLEALAQESSGRLGIRIRITDASPQDLLLLGSEAPIVKLPESAAPTGDEPSAPDISDIYHAFDSEAPCSEIVRVVGGQSLSGRKRPSGTSVSTLQQDAVNP